MSRSEVVALGLSVVAAVASAVAALQARTTFADLSALSVRVGKLEGAAPPAAAPPAPGPSNADLARELSALRAQVAALQTRAVPPDPGGKPSGEAAAADAAQKRLQLENEHQKVWLETMTTRLVSVLVEKLGLSAQQETQVRELMAGQVTAFREARLGKAGEDTKKAVEDLLADTNAKVKAVLTPEQQAEYDRIADRPGGIFALPVQAGPAVDGGSVRPAGR